MILQFNNFFIYLELALKLSRFNFILQKNFPIISSIKLEHWVTNLVKLTRLRTNIIVAIHDSLVSFSLAFMLSNTKMIN